VIRAALTVRADKVEDVLDRLLPLVPQGAHPTEVAEGQTELAVYGERDTLPSRAELEALAGDALLGYEEQPAPDDPRERRRRFGRTWVVANRLVIRPTDAPSSGNGLTEVVIDSPAGAFGTGAHPTTRMCLELLLELEPGGGFADLGCGAGVLAVAAAGLGWAPVFAVDHEPRSVEATARNAERNGVAVDAIQLDLTTVPPPPAPTMAANVPAQVHTRIAGRLAPAVVHVIVSGVIGSELDAVLAAYADAGLEPVAERGRAWRAVLLERSRG
jgi:ribosomal protein L11 methyltransferase